MPHPVGQRVIRPDATGVCTLTLNRPDKLNALDTMVFEELNTHRQDLERDEGMFENPARKSLR